MNCRLLLHLIKERLSFLQGCIDQHHSASINMFVHYGRHLLNKIRTVDRMMIHPLRCSSKLSGW